MSDKKLDKKQNATTLNDEQLENANGGYGIIHGLYGYKWLVDDEGNLVSKKFMDTYKANKYASEHIGFKKGKEWERMGKKEDGLANIINYTTY